MRVLIRREVTVAVPAARLWDHVTDWTRQGEWVPLTRVELADPRDPARSVGGRIRAWTGLGPVGFWDTMTITSWDATSDGGGRCEVLHTGAVVRGEGAFEVVGAGPADSLFRWSETVGVPLGRLGRVGWLLLRPLVERMIDRGLDRLRRDAEAAAPRRHAVTPSG